MSGSHFYCSEMAYLIFLSDLYTVTFNFHKEIFISFVSKSLEKINISFSSVTACNRLISIFTELRCREISTRSIFIRT